MVMSPTLDLIIQRFGYGEYAVPAIYKTHKCINEETIGDSNALFENRLIITVVFSKPVPLSPIVTDAHCSTIGVLRCPGTSKILQ